MRRTKQIDIKRALALAGTFSFLSSCAKSCLLPFLTLYFRQLGLSPAMTGIVMGTKHLLALLWRPVASLLAKHYNKRRAVINCSLLFSAAAALLLLLVPPADVSGADTGFCNASHPDAGLSQSLGENLVTTVAGPPTSTPTHPRTPRASSVTFTDTGSVHVMTNAPSLNRNDTKNSSDVLTGSLREPKTSGAVVYSAISSVATPARHKRSDFMSRQPEEHEGAGFGFLGSLKEMDAHSQLFLMILFIVSVWESVSAPLEWTVDDGLYEYLDFADASDRYSSSEVWGLLGAACGVGGTGLLVSQLSCVTAGQATRTAVHFYAYAVLAVLALPVAASLPLYLNRKRERASGLLKAAQLVYGSPRALLCTATILLVGVAASAVENFLLWQMQDRGGSELHMGLTLSLALLSQTAFPLLAGRLAKLLSPGRVLVVGAASLGLQCFYYSFLWGAWAALPAQLLSCLSSGGLWWAVTIQCEDVATPGAERSVRRVYNSLCLQLGSGLGSFAGGFVVQRFGLVWLYRGVAVGLMAWCACLPVLQWRAPHQRRINYSRLLAADASEASDSESEQERDWLDEAMEDDGGKNSYGRRISP